MTIPKEYPKLPIIISGDALYVYSQNYNAIKAHYFFIQFTHTIRQLLEKGINYITDLKMSIKEVSATLIQVLT